MKVSLNWIRDLSGVTTKTPELIDLIGSRLGGIEEVIDYGKRYEGVVIVRVVECVDHPNADRLHVCKVDDRGVTPKVKRDAKGLVQVVCGAPNVRAGMLAAWIPPGATVPSTFDKDPFVLEARELRGVVSNGMLASPQELGLGDSHAGLLELDGNAKAGATLAKTYELDDTIMDIENKMFTHRPDCFGQLGVAREIAGITHKKFASPGWYRADAKLSGTRGRLSLEVKNSVPKLVPRFSALVVENVEVGPSPVWLQAALAKLGAKPINNIVDITNYMMLLTAQPLHAYDYDKLSSGKLGVRLSRDGESIKLLNGKTVQLKKGAVVITDGTKPVGLGGVMGGAETEVSADTKNIVLESATFDMNLTRRTAFEYGLFTDAVTRFTKGQSPLQNMVVLSRAGEMVEQLAGGKLGKSVDDKNLAGKVFASEWSVHDPAEVSPQFINNRLGLSLNEKEIIRLLQNVEIEADMAAGQIEIQAPFWRTDIEIPEDVVEEVGRLYGYEHLSLSLPRRDIAPPAANPIVELKAKIRQTLTAAGGNEVLTYSFVSENLLKKAGQNPGKAFRLVNALSPGLEYYRISLTPSLLDKVNSNIRAGFDSFALFEIGKSHYVGETDPDDPKVPNEDNHVALVLAGSKVSQEGAAYYFARRYLDKIVDLKSLKLTPQSSFDLSKDEWGKQIASVYEPSRSAVIVAKNQIWGVVGEFTDQARQAFKLPKSAAGFEVHLDIVKKTGDPYKPLNRFPETEQDICLRSKTSQTYQELNDFICGWLDNVAKSHGYKYDLRVIDIYKRKEEPGVKQTTWRLSLSHPERTLTTEEVNNLLDELAASAKSQLGANRV